MRKHQRSFGRPFQSRLGDDLWLNLSNFLLLSLIWLLVLLVLSYRMLHAPFGSQPKYSELIGNLILAGLMITFLAAVTG